MLKKETLSTLEWLRDVHLQMLKELDEKYNGKSMLEIKENGRKALEESIEALNDVLCELRMMPEINKNSSWIPIKTKKLSPEEIREFCEKTHEFSPEEMDGAWSYDCKLPEKTQDVLVTTRYEDVVITKFVCDGCEWYFEDFEDEGDLLAWMPLPEPYKKEENA